MPPRQCVDCHVNGNYSLNSTLCYSCHQKDYANTNNPAHASAGFPTTCELCHDTTVWTDSTFNHDNTTFPLTGSHTVPPRQCTDCHVNGNYTTLPTHVCRLPPDGLQRHHEPGPQGAATVLPDYVPDLPQHDRLDGSDVQSHPVLAVPNQPWRRE